MLLTFAKAGGRNKKKAPASFRASKLRHYLLERETGLEPVGGLGLVERETGLEPATACLEGRNSTT